jgi:acetyl-CoA carboxylase carboxyltransferase component
MKKFLRNATLVTAIGATLIGIVPFSAMAQTVTPVTASSVQNNNKVTLDGLKKHLEELSAQDSFAKEQLNNFLNLSKDKQKKVVDVVNNPQLVEQALHTANKSLQNKEVKTIQEGEGLSIILCKLFFKVFPRGGNPLLT